MNHPVEIASSFKGGNSHELESPETDTSKRLKSSAGSTGMSLSRDPDSDDGGTKNDKAMTPLHKGFKPGDDDVICGRGKKCYAHTGNERFRQIVQSHLEQYSAASSRPEKSEILSIIVDIVRKNSPDGGFVKLDTKTGIWYEVGDFLAREKTSQAFRDALHDSYRSSKKSKHEKRRQRTKAKALLDKQASDKSLGAADEEFDQQRPALYPGSLVSRQQLTVLREEPPSPHPRAFSFSGQSHEPRVHSMPSRALSMSSGQGGGRLRDRNEAAGLATGEYGFRYGDIYQRPDTAPPNFYAPHFPVQQLQETGPSHWAQAEAGPDIWAGLTNRSALTENTAPQFHPVRAEDIAAHRSDPGTDSTMAGPSRRDSGNVCSWSTTELGGDFASRRHRNRDEHPPMERSVEPIPMGSRSVHPIGPPSLSIDQGYAAPPSGVAAMHQRTDSNASETVIVDHLASALQSESQYLDENPFEPIPLSGRSKKRPKTDGGDEYQTI